MRTRLRPATINRSRELRTHATDPERQLWYKLREMKRAGFHFRRQAPFRSYFLDFVEHSRKLVIELDGSQHGEPRNRIRDRIRDEVLRGEGYVVLRIWNGEIVENLDGVADFIFQTLQSRPPPARPSTSSGRATSPPGGGN